MRDPRVPLWARFVINFIAHNNAWPSASPYTLSHTLTRLCSVGEHLAGLPHAGVQPRRPRLMHAANAVWLHRPHPPPSDAQRVFAPDAERHAHYVALFEGVYLPLLESATSLSAEMQRIDRAYGKEPSSRG